MKHKTQRNINVSGSKIQVPCEGFTLLLAVLITSMVLAISFGFSIFVIRELNISIVGRESQKAVFAADSGIECALYWDLAQKKFATTSPPCPCTIRCLGQDYTVGGPAGISEFTLNFTNGACAMIKVNKITYYPKTRIESKGHSVCAAGGPIRTERAFRVTY